MRRKCSASPSGSAGGPGIGRPCLRALTARPPDLDDRAWIGDVAGHRQSASRQRDTWTSCTHDHDTRPILVLGGTGQDRPPRRRAAHGARPAGAHRLALRRAAVRLGGPVDLGAGAATASGGVRLLLPRPRDPGRGGDGRRVRRAGASRAASGGSCCCPAAARTRPQRAEQAVRDSGADWTILRCDLVQPELQRGLPARAGARGEVALPAGDVARAVRRRRRHRRRRGRGADRRPATSASSTS